MQDFSYIAAKTIQEATSLLAERGDKARPLAGGTDLLVQLRERLKWADLVVDIKAIPELNHLGPSGDGGLIIGAAVSCERIVAYPEVAQHFSAMHDAARIIGGWQIQTRASLGGNLCNSSPAADSTPALMVLDATLQIASPEGTQDVPVGKFCTGPGKNILRNGDLLVSLTLPAPPPKSGSAYQRFIPRNEMDIAVAGAASYVRLAEDGTVAACRIALGAVAPVPQMADDAASLLIGKRPTPEAIEQSAKAVVAITSPIDDMRGTIEFRQNLAYVLTKRTLQTAVDRALAEP